MIVCLFHNLNIKIYKKQLNFYKIKNEKNYIFNIINKFLYNFYNKKFLKYIMIKKQIKKNKKKSDIL